MTALQNDYDDGTHVSFDYNSTVCVVENCANIHIWNDLSDFVPDSYIKLGNNESTKISAINGKSNSPIGIGDVNLTWKDDSGKEFEITLKIIFHFPNRPIKILSAVGLADQLKNDWETWILSRKTQSTFTWDFGKY